MAQRNPVCSKCKATSSLMWHKTPNGSIICLDCQTAEKKATSSSPQSTRSASVLSDTTSHIDKNSQSHSPGPTTRRSTRSRERANRAKQQQSQNETNLTSVTNGNGTTPKDTTACNNVPIASVPTGSKETKQSLKPDNPKGPVVKVKDPVPASSNGAATVSCTTNFRDHHINQWQRGRRSMSFKLFQPTKLPISHPEIVTSDSMSHKGTKFEVGDVVSVLDEEGGSYYALVRGFLQDQYAEKYAVITWLLPRYPNPTHFDPTQFILGPEEDSPKSLNFLDFVCHSPRSKNFQASYFHNFEQAELWGQTS